jgi:mutator protein MutT
MKPGTDYIGIGVGAFILNEEGEVFLMKRGPKSKNEIGHWSLPGGTVEFGETMRDTILREVREELGIEIDLDGQLPATDHILSGEKQHWITTIFPARIIFGTPEILEPEKCTEIGWFALEALPTPLASSVEKAVNSFFNLDN